MIKQIYFDFGKVLVDYEKSLQTVSRDFSIEFDSILNLYKEFEYELGLGKITTADFWQQCIEKFNLKDAQNYDLPKSWVSDYDIIQPINDLIYSLENKIDIGIISNIHGGIWEAAVKYKMVPNIEYKKVYLSYQLGLIKPDIALFKLVQTESGVNPEEILFIDDKSENLIAPTNLGWKTILFNPNQAQQGVDKIKKMIL